LRDAGSPLHQLPDPEFLDALDERYGGVPAAARASEELMELLLPGLRADVSVCDTYVHRPGEPLDCPISAYGGTEDPAVAREDLEAWKVQTNGPLALRMFPGDHFFLQARQADVLGAIAAALETE
jgi:surfactin synthase thioesterase subunit